MLLIKYCNIYMKKSVLYFIAFCTVSFFSVTKAQEQVTKEQNLVIQSGDVESFKQTFSSMGYDKCLFEKDEGYSPFSLAVRFDKTKITDYLLKTKQVNVNNVCAGMTPLMEAARFGHKAMVKKLLSLGANKNLKNLKGKTASDLAKDWKEYEIVEMLK